jgi:hypothetical protein
MRVERKPSTVMDDEKSDQKTVEVCHVSSTSVSVFRAWRCWGGVRKLIRTRHYDAGCVITIP